MFIGKVQKRDGRVVAFDLNKIKEAVNKALLAVKGAKDDKMSYSIACEVAESLSKKFKGKVPHVEDIQDEVEDALIRRGLADVAKAYIIYRKKREEAREVKHLLGVSDDLKLSLNALRVLQKRYLLKDKRGKTVETPGGMFRRVAHAISLAEKKDVRQRIEAKFYEMMISLSFLPNSPTLMNAGTELGQLSACFVLPVEDSLQGIFRAVENMALVQQSGGGTGFSFSRLRPSGDVVRSTGGVASGPVSFMRVFDTGTDVIKQGGRRRGANMGILRVDHPDITEFITCKKSQNAFQNFNLSVAVTDEFMDAVLNDGDYALINPRNGEEVRRIHARDIFDLICVTAWETGDPGLVFIDEINRKHPLKKVGEIEATNPCGEQPLLPYESCNLGSINLEKFVNERGEIAWDSLREAVATGVRFLDDVIDVNKYPLPEIERITKANRKIGLGIMGFADMLIKMEIPYNSTDGIRIGEKMMSFIFKEAAKVDEELGMEKGSFPNFELSTWKRNYRSFRNGTICTIAPTGTLSIIAGCSSGIEPLFAVAFVRNVMEGTKLVEVNPHFESVARRRGFYSRSLMLKIAKEGSVAQIGEVPKDVREVFVTALDIEPEWHVRMQAAFQKYCDNAVAKTVNLPHSAVVKDVWDVYLLAYKMKCKGITVYRYGSRPFQVLYIGAESGERYPETGFVSADAEFAGGCPAPVCPPAMV